MVWLGKFDELTTHQTGWISFISIGGQVNTTATNPGAQWAAASKIIIKAMMMKYTFTYTTNNISNE